MTILLTIIAGLLYLAYRAGQISMARRVERKFRRALAANANQANLPRRAA